MAVTAHLLCGWDNGDPYSQVTAIHQRFVGWAAAQIVDVEGPRSFGKCTCIAVVKEPRLDITPSAVVIYHNHDAQHGVMEISMAASTPRWATKGTIRACLHYPFVQVHCGVVVCRVPRNAKRTRRFLQGIGFKLCGMVPRGFGNRDCAIYALTREDADRRWLAPRVEMKEAA